jgi:hypothetical protein
LIFPWNKSLPAESVVYKAAQVGSLMSAIEDLSAKSRDTARFLVEAVPAA